VVLGGEGSRVLCAIVASFPWASATAGAQPGGRLPLVLGQTATA
jgi:hypothetical protein